MERNPSLEMGKALGAAGQTTIVRDNDSNIIGHGHGHGHGHGQGTRLSGHGTSVCIKMKSDRVPARQAECRT